MEEFTLIIDIEFGTVFYSEQHEAVMRSIMDQFERQSHIHVKIVFSHLENLRDDYNRIALYGHGPDVSDIGSTWVFDMANMNTLRPFTDAEVTSIAKPGEIPDTAWEPCRTTGNTCTWGIPWRCDSVFIHYRKDWLKQAGIDETIAFRSLTDLSQTAMKLRETGIDVPVELAYHKSCDRFTLFHALSGWIWANGGEYCTLDGKCVLFDQPPAMEAICGYMGLMRWLSPEGVGLIREGSPFLFDQGKAAIQFWGYYNKSSLVGRERKAHTCPQVLQNWGAVPYPNGSQLGGQYLVVWKHTHHEKEAIELVRYLTSLQVQLEMYHQFGDQPSRLDALGNDMFKQDPILKISVEATRKGRSYPIVPLWGLIENRLLIDLAQIQECLLSNPTSDVETLVHQIIPPVAYKLNLTLSAR